MTHPRNRWFIFSMADFDSHMYAKAQQLVAPPRGKASVFHLQHHLLVDWNTATALLEQMVADGHIPTYAGRRVPMALVSGD